jgi:hypothetical protein
MKSPIRFYLVIPAQAGIQDFKYWTPACAGVTTYSVVTLK